MTRMEADRPQSEVEKVGKFVDIFHVLEQCFMHVSHWPWMADHGARVSASSPAVAAARDMAVRPR
ncbi:hypothetical protein CQW49_02475 [Methylosinus trichosporium OB3b]|uniref:Uncharacterized protein n=1 Tax=Methylosinus trichosporium (strain ATCC 35070 / NCIMB 11131 / UNIQEM 75 / OB3b) TaxID=595536 RepID=A0A2D2CW01_METT3|nr:hypothetical protein CQW49_02475 [Methylosinus trichosporium OB3b]OBS54151.1 hypothetical protein A8B73_02665 [Methylosinus sp. 3S-1]